jgi:hypothetical protein
MTKRKSSIDLPDGGVIKKPRTIREKMEREEVELRKVFNRMFLEWREGELPR